MVKANRSGIKTNDHEIYIHDLLMLLIAELSFAQSDFPDFLQGTWKMENKEIYEHWDKLNENTLKGFSYKLKGGQMTISEYLDISRYHKDITYTATVLNQNQGMREFVFKRYKTDSTFAFENPDHEFPRKRIVYQN